MRAVILQVVVTIEWGEHQSHKASRTNSPDGTPTASLNPSVQMPRCKVRRGGIYIHRA